MQGNLHLPADGGGYGCDPRNNVVGTVERACTPIARQMAFLASYGNAG
jgi:hypothetical protein